LGVVLLLASPLACKTPSTNVNVADPEGADAGEPSHTEATTSVPYAAVEKIEISSSVSGVGDMFDAASSILNMWSPPEPGMPATNLLDFAKLAMIQEGFAPRFFESIDLDGTHVLSFAFPQDDQPQTTDADIDLALSLASSNAADLVESMPQSMQPQPMGDNMWQSVEDEVLILFRARPRALEIALSMADLDRAGMLAAQASPTPRFQLRASNLPAGDIDISELIPMPDEGAGLMSSIFNETTAVQFYADFGTDRAFSARAEAEAPFERLGLDPIGPATQRESELAKTLPAGALGVWVMPWGDPGLLHTLLDKRIPIDQIPAPFDGYVDDIVGGLHGVLGSIHNEVLATAYLDDKGNLTIVFAAEISDEAGARKAMREIWGAAEKAFSDHIALTDGSADHRYAVKFKVGAGRAGKFKTDHFSLTLPKSIQDSFENARSLLGKNPKLEISTVIADGKLVVAIGAGHRQFMANLGRRLGKAKAGGLEAGGGLALARGLSAGCQHCVAIDPVQVGKMVFTIIATDPDEPAAVQKAAKSAIQKLAKAGIEGEVALAARFETGRGALGFGIPKELLFIDAAKVKTVIDLFDSVDAARVSD